MNINNIDELKRMIKNYKGVLNATPIEDAYIARGLIKDIDLCKRRLMEEIELGGEYDG